MEKPFSPETEAAIETIKALSPEERLKVFGQFCKHCGKDDPFCGCWEDETA